MDERPNMVILAMNDNVGIALQDIDAGGHAHTLAGDALDAVEDIPQGHKIALQDIQADDRIMRLGMAVGIAKAPIRKGHLVHVHNVASRYLNNDEDHYE